MTRAQVVAAFGPGTDLPENPGEADSVAYVFTLADGARVQVHVIYAGDVVDRVVVSRLVTSGGGR